jgi:hypothetical protein
LTIGADSLDFPLGEAWNRSPFEGGHEIEVKRYCQSVVQFSRLCRVQAADEARQHRFRQTDKFIAMHAAVVLQPSSTPTATWVLKPSCRVYTGAHTAVENLESSRSWRLTAARRAAFSGPFDAAPSSGLEYQEQIAPAHLFG